MLLDGMTIATLAIALPLIQKTYVMSPLMTGAVSAAGVVGMVVGAIAGGRASDRLGRRRLFLCSMMLIALAGAVSGIAWSPFVILISQFLIGVGQGSEFPNSSAYVAEIMPRSVRQRMLVATIAMQSVGMLVGVGLGYLLLVANPEIASWRYFLGIRAVVAAAILLLRCRLMPESPVWLMSRGRNADAADVIAALAPNAKSKLTGLAIEAGGQQLESRAEPGEKLGGWSELFSYRYWRRTVLAAGAWALMDISTYGVGQFAPVVLAKLYSGETSGNTIAAEFSSIRGAFLLDGFLLLGFVLGMWLVPRVGPIRMQCIGFLGMVLGLVILIFALGSTAGNGPNMGLVIVGFSVFNLLMNMGPNSTTFGLPALLFPPEIKATAAGFSAACAKIGATAGTLLLPSLARSVGRESTLAILAALCGLGFLITAVLGRGMLSNEKPET